MNRAALVLLAASLLSLLPPTASADQQSRARQLGAVCAACHRADGGNSGIPPIAGLDETRIVQRMDAYRAQTRGDQIMHVVASSLTPDDIALVAHYYAGRTATPARP